MPENTEDDTQDEHRTFSLEVRCAAGDRYIVGAYETDVPGLAVHHRIMWSQAKEEYITDDERWQVTHIPTGRGLLTPHRTLHRMKDAYRLVHRLRDIASWPTVSAESIDPHGGLHNSVVALWEQISEEYKREIGMDEPVSPKSHVVSHNREEGKFEVINRFTDEVVDEAIHRGAAWNRAWELNISESEAELLNEKRAEDANMSATEH